jgi:hypothetical protein
MCVCKHLYPCCCLYTSCRHPTYACMHVCMYACIYICIHTYMYVLKYSYMYASMYVFMYECMYVCMYVCTHTVAIQATGSIVVLLVVTAGVLPRSALGPPCVCVNVCACVRACVCMWVVPTRCVYKWSGSGYAR